MTGPAERPLWTCPRCGNRFVTRNLSHSCGTWPLDGHFERRPHLRPVFDAFRAALEANGPVTVVVSKTRIAFMDRVRFAAVSVRKDCLQGHFWLAEPMESPLFFRCTQLGPKAWIHEFRLRAPGDVTEELRRLARLAAMVGAQAHLKPAQAAGGGPT